MEEKAIGWRISREYVKERGYLVLVKSFFHLHSLVNQIRSSLLMDFQSSNRVMNGMINAEYIRMMSYVMELRIHEKRMNYVTWNKLMYCSLEVLLKCHINSDDT